MAVPFAIKAMAAQPAQEPEIAGPSMLKDITVGRVMKEKVRGTPVQCCGCQTRTISPSTCFKGFEFNYLSSMPHS
jgi:hypothetical protein